MYRLAEVHDQPRRRRIPAGPLRRTMQWSAVKAAERVYGVRAVADEIEVKLSASNVRDDSDTAQDISRKMESNTAIPESVKAEVIKGHLTLRGEVQWAYRRGSSQQRTAGLAAASAPGLARIGRGTRAPAQRRREDVRQAG